MALGASQEAKGASRFRTPSASRKLSTGERVCVRVPLLLCELEVLVGGKNKQNKRSHALRGLQ
jgi:hypothetical protein